MLRIMYVLYRNQEQSVLKRYMNLWKQVTEASTTIVINLTRRNRQPGWRFRRIQFLTAKQLIKRVWRQWKKHTIRKVDVDDVEELFKEVF